MLNCEDLEFSLKDVSVRRDKIRCLAKGIEVVVNSAIQCPICPRLHKFDKSPGLNTSKEQYPI